MSCISLIVQQPISFFPLLLNKLKKKKKPKILSTEDFLDELFVFIGGCLYKIEMKQQNSWL